jgi:hypothetical protein
MKKSQPREPRESSIKLALDALEPTQNPLDMSMGGLDPSPTSLDFPAPQETRTCPHHRYVCAECGRPLRRGGK